MDDETRLLNKKNFNLARALAATQRKIADLEHVIQQTREHHERWLHAVHHDLDFLASMLIEAQEAYLNQP